MVRGRAVARGSLGAALGLVPGTELHAVNGRALEDFLDWEFWSADEQFVLSATLPGGDVVEYDVERPEGLPLGVALEAPRIRRCANHCDFCFVDGNPAGMRAPLYIRDDDYRLSFRYGNFATLTNLKPWDVARIVEYRLSPLYVSVHATDPTIRRWLLRNPEAPEIVPQLRALAERGFPWCYGADDLYLQAGEPLPPAEWYGDFEQRENGVGAVRYLQTQIAAARDRLPDLAGTRIGVVTGTAMGPLMPQVLAEVAAVTGAQFELVVVENALFGPSVTTAGLLPAAAIEAALRGRDDLDLVLLPAAAGNDDLIFMDDVRADDLAARVPMTVRLSHDFADVLSDCGLRIADCGLESAPLESAIDNPQSAMAGGEGREG